MVGRAALAGGALGFVAGIAARLAMRVLFLLNPETEGLLVGEIFPVGGFTAQGTGVILFQGVLLGAFAGAIYGLVRRSLPERPLLAGATFGAWLVCVFLGLLMVGEDRDFQLFGPVPVAVGFFGIVFMAFGTGLGLATGRVDAGPTERPRRALSLLTRSLLAASAIAGVVVLAGEIAART